MKRLLFFMAFMGLGTWFLLAILVTEPVPVKPDAQTASGSADVMAMEKVVIRHMDGNRLSWELWAKTATLREDGKLGTLHQVRFRIYPGPEKSGNSNQQKGLKPALARRGVIEGKSGLARLENNPSRLLLEKRVVLRQGREIEIRTGLILFDQKNNLMRAPHKVWMKTPNGIHEGDSLLYSLDDETLTFTRPVFSQ